MVEIDWQAEARRAANHIASNMSEAHRGAISWEHVGVVAVFGNDGYETDERARAEVGLVRAHLNAFGTPEMGFATDDDGYTWTMLVGSEEPTALEQVVWAAWGAAYGPEPSGVYEQVQRKIAARTADQFGERPKHSIN